MRIAENDGIDRGWTKDTSWTATVVGAVDYSQRSDRYEDW